MITEAKQRSFYVIGDYLSTNVALLLFNAIRYRYLDLKVSGYPSIESFLGAEQVVLGQILFPVMMLGIYYLSGYYNNIFFKSRLQEMKSTFTTAFIGMLLIYFIAIMNDDIPDRLRGYELMAVLLLLLLVFVYAVRFCITGFVAGRVHRRLWSLNTLIIGTSEGAFRLGDKLRTAKKSMGFNIIGYVAPEECPGNDHARLGDLPVYDIEEIDRVCRKHNVKELILVPYSDDSKAMLTMINRLLSLDLPIYVPLDAYHLLISKSKVSDVGGEPLVNISKADISPSTVNLKRVSDIVVSCLTLTVLSPFLAVIALAIKLDSKGPVIYRQQRIGYHKKPFYIYKFRSMRVDAETDGPLLSSLNDPRITPLGRFLRKYRLDELPQFWNVVRGEMSIVGPRPEREYYIRQIQKKAPYYTLVHQVRPGITSWGMVKYGYATDIDSMINRLEYDLIYLENISFLIDLKILFYTISTVLTGKGI